MSVKFFVSYCHEDKRYLTAFSKHLAVMKQQGLIEEWTDLKIKAGENIDNEVKENLENSDVLISLMSSSYLNSYYCIEKELKKAKKKNKIIIAIIIKNCDWQEHFIKCNKVLPEDGKPITRYRLQDDGWNYVVKNLRVVISDFQKDEFIIKSTNKSEKTKLVKENNNKKLTNKRNSNANEKIIELALPLNKKVSVPEEVLFKTAQEITKNLVDLTSNLSNVIHDSMKAELSVSKRFTINKKIKVFKIFLLAMCKYIAIDLFENNSVRVHVRRYDRESHSYVKYVAAYNENEYEEELSPIPAGKGLIKVSRENHCSVLRSLNLDKAIDTKNCNTYKEYLTYAIEGYEVNRIPILTFGISAYTEIGGEVDERVKMILYFLNFIKIENFILSFIEMFKNITNIDIITVYNRIEGKNNEKNKKNK